RPRTRCPTWSTSTSPTCARSSARTSSPPAAARGMSSMFRSLRWRLLAWHAGILVLTVAGFGAALYARIRQVRLGEVDAELRAAARPLEGILALPPPPPRDDGFGPPPFRDRPPPRPDDMDRPPPPRDRPDPRHDRHLERVLTLPPSHRRDGEDA